MYMPFYSFAAPTKSMQSTQKIMRTIKSTRIFSLFVTVITVLCDLSQIRYFSDLTLNDSFFASMGVSLVVVLGLDVSMFIFGCVVDEYRKTSGANKKTFLLSGIGLICVFVFSYLIYITLALPVLLEQSANGETPFFGRLLIPVASSLLAFFSSISWNPKEAQIQALQNEKVNVEADIASAKNTIAKIDRDFQKLDVVTYENAQAERVLDSLLAQVKAATFDARILLAQELGSTASADELLSEAGLCDTFWETARAKLCTSDALFPSGNPVKEVPEASPTADSNSMPGISLDLTA